MRFVSLLLIIIVLLLFTAVLGKSSQNVKPQKKSISNQKNLSDLLSQILDKNNKKRLSVIREISQKNFSLSKELGSILISIILDKDESSELKNESLSLLNHLGYFNNDPKILLKIIKNYVSEDETRINAILIYSTLEDPENKNLDFLKSIFAETEQITSIRKACAIGIGLKKDKLQLEWFLDSLRNELDDEVFGGLCEGLSNYKTDISDEHLKMLLYRLPFVDDHIKSIILKTVIYSQNSDIIRILYDIYKDSQEDANYNHKVGALLLESIISSCNSSKTEEQFIASVNVLIELLRTETNSLITKDAIRLLIRFGRYDLQSLRDILNDEEKSLRLNVTYILGQLRDKESLPILEKAMQATTDQYERQIISQAINFIKYTF